MVTKLLAKRRKAALFLWFADFGPANRRYATLSGVCVRQPVRGYFPKEMEARTRFELVCKDLQSSG